MIVIVSGKWEEGRICASVFYLGVVLVNSQFIRLTYLHNNICHFAVNTKVEIA